MGLYDAPSLNKIKVGTFKGIDVSVPEDQQQPYRAADALNMIPDASGEVRKRPGIQKAKNQLDLKIETTEMYVSYGIEKIYTNRFLLATKWRVATTWEPTVIGYSIILWLGGKWVPCYPFESEPTVVKVKERYFVFGHYKDEVRAMFVIDDHGYVVYRSDGHYERTINGSYSEGKVEYNDPYLTFPTINVGCEAGGGGTPHQQTNLLNPWVTESFCIKNQYGENTFYLSDIPDITSTTDRIDGDGIADLFYVEVLTPVTEQDDQTGEKIERLVWKERKIVSSDGYRQSSNRIFLSPAGTDARAKITDAQSPGVGNIIPSPKPGEDNVRISYRRKGFAEGFSKLCDCLCGTVYGVGGYKDRLFLGGPENKIYYSEQEDPFYIGALNYVQTEDSSKVMALDGTGGALSVITDKGIVLLSGQASTPAEDSYVTDATFVISNTIPAPAPIGYNNTAILGGEIVYLSKEGIIAIASKENYAERYAEYRSALIDRKMLKDKPHRILNFGRYLLIFCAGGICWLLDENQPNKDGNKPYAAHQYEGYRMSGFYNNSAYVEDDTLKLVNGVEIYQWMDGSLPEHYHDRENIAIEAYWETPWIYGSNFYKNKIFMRLGVLLGELKDLVTGATVESNTGVVVEGKKNDEDWKVFMDEKIVSRTFSFSRLDFRYFTFRRTAEMPAMTRKIKVKKAKRFKLRFSNNTIDQPFILQEYGLDYVQED